MSLHTEVIFYCYGGPAKLLLMGQTLFTGDPELHETENGVENYPEKEEEITQRATPFDASKIAEDRSRSPSTKSADSISEAVFKPPVNSTPGKYSQPPLTSTTSKVLSENFKIS